MALRWFDTLWLGLAAVVALIFSSLIVWKIIIPKYIVIRREKEEEEKKRYSRYLMSFFSPFYGIWAYHQLREIGSPELQEHAKKCLKAAKLGFVMFLIFILPMIIQLAK